MEALVEAVLSLVKNIVFLVSQFVDILGAAIVVPGIVVLILAILIWWIAWKNTKNVLGTLIAIFAFFGATYVISAYVFFPWMYKGSDAAINSCVANATNEKQKALCNKLLTSDYVIAATVQTPLGGTIIINDDPDPVITMVREFKSDALTILVKGWNSFPPDWPRNIPGQLVGPQDVPKGLIVTFSCDNAIAGVGNERWVVTVMGDVPGIGQKSVEIEANGYFVRDTSGFNAKPGTSIIGTGTWEDACPTCYVDTPMPTPTPTPAPTAAPPAVTKVEFPQPVCGYWGYYFFSDAWLVVPTTGGQADYQHATSVATATADINNRCPGESLPATP